MDAPKSTTYPQGAPKWLRYSIWVWFFYSIPTILFFFWIPAIGFAMSITWFAALAIIVALGKRESRRQQQGPSIDASDSEG